MSKISSVYFKEFLSDLVSDFKGYKLTEVVGKGIPLSTAQKIRRTTNIDELYKTKTQTIATISKTVDTLNREFKVNRKESFEEIFNNDFKEVVETAQKMFEQKRMSASSIATVSATQIRKIRTQGTSSNYYLETIGEIADYIQKTILDEQVSELREKQSELERKEDDIENKKRELENELNDIRDKKSIIVIEREKLEIEINEFLKEKQKQAKNE